MITTLYACMGESDIYYVIVADDCTIMARYPDGSMRPVTAQETRIAREAKSVNNK